MRLALRLVHQAVARADLVRLAVLPREPRAAEDEEDLLVGAVHVRGRRDLALVELDAMDAGVHRACGAAEVRPRAAEPAARRPARLEVVPVRESHSAIIACSSMPASSAAR